MSQQAPSSTSSPPSDGTHDEHTASQSSGHDVAVETSPISNADTPALSLESSFQLEMGYPPQPPESQRHPKGKRKRTTTQDKAILEAAYNSNPKPDKAARLDIVKRVSLNEKEVQIWFQNRRQNDRRKSRPLSPQEIAALRFGGGLHILSSSEPVVASIDLDQATADGETRPGESDQQVSFPGAAGLQHSVHMQSRASIGCLPSAVDVPEKERRHSDSAMPLNTSSDETTADQKLSQSLSSSIGYLSNRWNHGHRLPTPASGGDSFRLDSFTTSTQPGQDSDSASTLPPPPTSSQIRLSLSLDGKAELVSSQMSSQQAPSLSLASATLPPVRHHRTLQRSRSALPGITLPPISTLTASLPPQLSRSRSRDVHAWERCLEANSTILDELTTQAENESSGSAIAAISLLRSSSQTALSSMVHSHSHVSLSSAGKRIAPPTRRDPNKKPKLSRSTSSVARMQSVLSEKSNVNRAMTATPELNPEKKHSKASLTAILTPSGGDSDKENWSPDEEGHYIGRRRPLPSAAPAKLSSQLGGNPRRTGRVLGDQGVGNRRSLLSRANTAPISHMRRGKKADSPVSIFEDDENEDEDKENRENQAPAKEARRSDDEVDRFMRGEVSPSKKGDFDCVAGLLSLSQGNWR